ncbi:MAG: hypothetical protein KAT65_06965 [Methanophagales archaeon]|nr:hypothetical protein [Methanophagales archaeon]
MNEQHTERNLKLRLEFKEAKRPFLLDISSLFYDFELLHDFAVILTYEDYFNYSLTQRFFWYRNGRPIKSGHKLKSSKIIKESPLIIGVVIGAIGAIWILLQAIDKISSWKLNRKKLQLEIEKLQLDINKSRYDEEKAHIELEYRIEQRKALKTFNSIVRRLNDNPIKLVDISAIEDEKENVD